jgi:DNA-binding SARP family transcriptional activator
VWERPVLRSFISGSLWPDSDAERANASLRSALWRLHTVCSSIIIVTPSHLGLHPDVHVDYRDAVDWSRVVLANTESLPTVWSLQEITTLTREVLPDWYEDWAQLARERFRQLRLHALETICQRLASNGRYAEALLAGLSAVAIEPLRESAHRQVIDVHLAEHNIVEALREYRSYEALLRSQLSLRPSAELRAYVAGTLEAARTG